MFSGVVSISGATKLCFFNKEVKMGLKTSSVPLNLCLNFTFGGNELEL